MMKIRYAITAAVMLLASLTGFAGSAAKPDFAFPKQVTQKSQKELDAALAADNGPATLRAVMNLALARTLMEPDSMAAVERLVADVTERVPAGSRLTRAMLLLLRADITGSVQWADSALTYTPELQQAQVKDWKQVVTADAQFTPLLYDFAVSKRLSIQPSDSLLTCVRDFHRHEPYLPYFYWSLYSDCNWPRCMELIGHYAHVRSSWYLLIRAVGEVWGVEQRAALYRACLDWKERFGSDRKVEHLIKDLTSPEVSLNCREVCAPDSALTVHITGMCVNSLQLRVARVKPAEEPLFTRRVEIEGTGVFAVDTVVQIHLPGFGVYSITPVLAEGKTGTGRHQSHCRVAVTNMMASRETYGTSKPDLMALNVITGRQITDVKWTADPGKRGRLTPVAGNDRYAMSVWADQGYTHSDTTVHRAVNLVTDRAIYHPGDTVKFAATFYKYSPSGTRLWTDARESVTLMDANYNQVAMRNLESDSLGRASGFFVLPASGLTGYHSLMAGTMGRRSFMVSDYKAPLFTVEAGAARTDSATVSLRGNAQSYSGYPVQNATVRVKVYTLRPRAWMWDYLRMTDRLQLSDSTVTDSVGAFSLTLNLPADVALRAEVEVTSALGETHSADCFIPARKYYIASALTEYLRLPLDGDKDSQLIRVMDTDGRAVSSPGCRITLTASDSGRVFTVRDRAGWNSLPSGLYSLTATIDGDPSLADTLHVSRLVVYRLSDKVPPVTTALWCPESTVASGSPLLLGSSYAESHIRYTLWSADSIIEQRWIDSDHAGNFTVIPLLPKGVDSATLTLWSVRDYDCTTATVNVRREHVAKSLNVKISSMRDHITAGDRELWTITVTDNLGTPAPNAAVMLTAYSKALDALASMDYFNFNPRRWWGWNYSHSIYGDGRDHAWQSIDVETPSAYRGAPSFELYNMGWQRRSVRHYGMMMAARSAGVYSATDTAEEEEGAVLYDTVVENKMAAAAPTEKTESASFDDAEEAVDGDAGDSPAGCQVNYRPSEVPQALWAPVLTTGTDGSLQLQFVAPDANATWAIRALAYNADMLTGQWSGQIVASKPVMVQSRLPRFLRSTDSLPLMATVMNATDSARVVEITVELFDPATGAVVKSLQWPADTLAAQSSRVVEMPYVATDVTMIGYRVSATSGEFTDGEQTIIPVLDSAVDLTESRAFFLPADSASLTLDVAPGSVVSITANAVWECVKALPGLREDKPRSAFAATSSLFSACVASGLLRTYPEIGKALHRWERDDSALVSHLQRNEDLKLALLANTPWVGAAQSQSERMARLLLLFDRKLTDAAINDAIEALALLVRKGGLSWTPDGSEASLWVTGRVLGTLAQLSRMGYLPESDRLKRLIDEGVKYLDSETARAFVKNPKGDFMDYVECRMAFPAIAQPLAARKVTTATVQRLVSDWRELSLRDKARAAIILHGNGYQATAAQVLESLRQYSAWRQTGLTAIVLRAFATVEPRCAEVDVIRQWLLSRKQSTEWGSGLQTSDLVDAILTTGSRRWLVPAANALSITMDGEPQPVDAENVMGEYRFDLPRGARLEMRKGDFPAWGGVWTRTDTPVDSVAAVGCDEMKIARTMSGELKVGGKVTVTLTIEATQPMDYVLVRSPRPAAFEPVNQLPRRLWTFGPRVYVEPVATHTNYFLNRMPKGVTVITEEFYVTDSGSFLMAPAEAQSQYAPEFSAHSAGLTVSVTAGSE